MTSSSSSAPSWVFFLGLLAGIAGTSVAFHLGPADRGTARAAPADPHELRALERTVDELRRTLERCPGTTATVAAPRAELRSLSAPEIERYFRLRALHEVLAELGTPDELETGEDAELLLHWGPDGERVTLGVVQGVVAHVARQ